MDSFLPVYPRRSGMVSPMVINVLKKKMHIFLANKPERSEFFKNILTIGLVRTDYEHLALPLIVNL